jgi:hypothetical protein
VPVRSRRVGTDQYRRISSPKLVQDLGSSLRPPTHGTLVLVAISIEDLRAIAARARAKAEADGELTRKGPAHLDLPPSICEAIWEDLASGAYEKAARAATAGDPEIIQL